MGEGGFWSVRFLAGEEYGAGVGGEEPNTADHPQQSCEEDVDAPFFHGGEVVVVVVVSAMLVWWRVGFAGRCLWALLAIVGGATTAFVKLGGECRCAVR